MTLAIASLAASGLARAQSEELISAKFRCLSWETPIRENLYVRTQDEMRPVRIHNVRRSDEVDYVGPNPVVFYRKAEGAEGASFEPFVRVDLNRNLRQPLLFFVPSDGGFRVIQMEDSFAVYPKGSYRFYNFTEQKLLTKFGDDRLTLEPKKTMVLEQPFEGNTQYPILIVIRESEEIRPLYSNVWRHNENFRYMILISESGSKDLGPVEFRVLSDYEETDSESGS